MTSQHHLQHSNSDWDQWARLPMTQAFVAELLETIEETKERWTLGHFTSEDTGKSAHLNLVALAGVDMLKQVIAAVEAHKTPLQIEEPTNDD